MALTPGRRLRRRARPPLRPHLLRRRSGADRPRRQAPRRLAGGAPIAPTRPCGRSGSTSRAAAGPASRRSASAAAATAGSSGAGRFVPFAARSAPALRPRSGSTGIGASPARVRSASALRPARASIRLGRAAARPRRGSPPSAGALRVPRRLVRRVVRLAASGARRGDLGQRRCRTPGPAACSPGQPHRRLRLAPGSPARAPAAQPAVRRHSSPLRRRPRPARRQPQRPRARRAPARSAAAAPVPACAVVRPRQRAPRTRRPRHPVLRPAQSLLRASPRQLAHRRARGAAGSAASASADVGAPPAACRHRAACCSGSSPTSSPAPPPARGSPSAPACLGVFLLRFGRRRCALGVGRARGFLGRRGSVISSCLAGGTRLPSTRTSTLHAVALLEPRSAPRASG